MSRAIQLEDNPAPAPERRPSTAEEVQWVYDRYRDSDIKVKHVLMEAIAVLARRIDSIEARLGEGEDGLEDHMNENPDHAFLGNYMRNDALGYFLQQIARRLDRLAGIRR